MVVEWTSGTTSIVYRRYSMFFDFQVSARHSRIHPHLIHTVSVVAVEC